MPLNYAPSTLKLWLGVALFWVCVCAAVALIYSCAGPQCALHVASTGRGSEQVLYRRCFICVSPDKIPSTTCPLPAGATIVHEK